MNYVEFNPQPIWGEDTNGVGLIFKLLNEKNPSWMTQSNSAVRGWACQGGNGLFTAIVGHLSDDDKKTLLEREQTLNKICSAVAEFVKKDYDVTFSRTVEKERAVTIDVPKVRKVGFFKKEEYIDHETKIEKYTEDDIITYKGWRIERLIRSEGFGNGASSDVMILDYCLGADGKLYMIASEQNSKDGSEVVLRCICYSPLFLSNTFCNVYAAAVSGVIGTLDAIPMDESDPARNNHITLDDDYFYNFPIQIDEGASFPYGFLDGTICRLIRLLDESDKEACYRRYEWMSSFLYPQKQTVESKDIKSNSNMQTKGTDSTRKFSFDEFVLFSANEFSRKPHAEQKDEFMTNPNGCFLSAFLTERLVAADDLAKRYPQYDELVTRIVDNQQLGLSYEKLSEERQVATNLAGEHIDNDKEIFVLLTAYQAFLSQGTTDEGVRAINRQMAETIRGLDIVVGGWEELMVAVALWFFDANNFQEAVKKKYIEIKDTPEYLEGGRKYKFETFIKAGYKLICNNSENPGDEFLSLILSHRRKLAENVKSCYPDFNRVLDAMDASDDALMNSGDFASCFVNESNVICDYISDQNDILENQDYLILGASIMSFMGRFSDPEENDGRLFIGRIESIGEEIYTLPRIALYCAALWYSDYKNYKQLLADVINDPESI